MVKAPGYESEINPTVFSIYSSKYNQVDEVQPDVTKLDDTLYQLAIKKPATLDNIQVHIAADAFPTIGNFASDTIAFRYIPLTKPAIAYPNPAVNRISFASPQNKYQAMKLQSKINYKKIEIYDIYGNLVLSVEQEYDAIDIGSLPLGVYNVLIYNSFRKNSTFQILESRC